jgi:hypothetical protein
MKNILDNIDEFSKLTWVSMTNAQAKRLNNLDVDEILRKVGPGKYVVGFGIGKDTIFMAPIYIERD